jgi:hypothetical protein
MGPLRRFEEVGPGWQVLGIHHADKLSGIRKIVLHLRLQEVQLLVGLRAGGGLAQGIDLLDRRLPKTPEFPKIRRIARGGIMQERGLVAQHRLFDPVRHHDDDDALVQDVVGDFGQALSRIPRVAEIGGEGQGHDQDGGIGPRRERPGPQKRDFPHTSIIRLPRWI